MTEPWLEEMAHTASLEKLNVRYPRCAECGCTITDKYIEVMGKTFCEDCIESMTHYIEEDDDYETL